MAKQTINKSTVRKMVTESIRKYLNEMYYGYYDEGEQTPEMVKQQFDGLRSHSFDMSDMSEDYGEIYFDYDPSTNKMIAGWATNAGLHPQFELDYDLERDLDYNLNGLYEYLSEQLAQQQFESRVRNGIVDAVCESLGISKTNRKRKMNEGELYFWDVADILENNGWDCIDSNDVKYKGQDALYIRIEPRRKASPINQVVNELQNYVGEEGKVVPSSYSYKQAPEIKGYSILIAYN